MTPDDDDTLKTLEARLAALDAQVAHYAANAVVLAESLAKAQAERNAAREEANRIAYHRDDLRHQLELAAEHNMNLARERDALAGWQCQSCGARFGANLGPAAASAIDGVTRCSRCAEVEVLTRERDEVKSLLAQYELVMTQDDHKLVQDLADAQQLAQAFRAEVERLRARLREVAP